MLPAAAPPGRAERSGAGSGAAPAAWLGWAGRLGPCVRRHRSTCAPSRAAGEAPERGRASPAGRGITPPGANPAQGAAPRPGPRLRPRRRRCAAPSAAAARRPGPARPRAERRAARARALRGRAGLPAGSLCGVSLRPGPAQPEGEEHRRPASATGGPGGGGADSPCPGRFHTGLGARTAGALGASNAVLREGRSENGR
ncbi:skin secretory protein xP2-like [Aquila chrysaetos chrysaetos]|uniref:skin secretory protein xP2-like n=1 Tax=Aquila chrysaetos chrysaetos TaxID=223781 RepID=UPI001176EF85|nr:skin secretory protein xP2-like [Aquila chrysaetos chrysaetos]